MKAKNYRIRIGERGTILLTVMIVVFVVAAMSGIVMERARVNMEQQQQQRRISQSRNVAGSAVSMAIYHLNQTGFNAYPDAGTFPLTTLTSADADFPPVVNESGATMLGHPEFDGLNNDDDTDAAGNPLIDEPGEGNPLEPAGDPIGGAQYRGGIYRIRVGEWTTSANDKIGVPGFDDDGDGIVDESANNGVDDDGDGVVDEADEDEVTGYSEDKNRKFTVFVEASYGNYATEMRAYLDAPEIPREGFAVYAKNKLEVQPNVITDSYDNHTYSASNSLDVDGDGNPDVNYDNNKGSIGAGEVVSDDTMVDLAPNDYIMGDVRTSGTITKDSDAYVDGESVEKDDQLPSYPDVKDFTISPSATDLNVNTNTTLTKGTYEFDNINVAKNTKLTIEGGSEIYVNSIDTKSGSEIISDISNQENVKVYVKQTMYMAPNSKAYIVDGGSESLNSRGLQFRVKDYYAPDNKYEVEMKSSLFRGVMYAPNANLKLYPNGENFGQFVTRDTRLQPKGSSEFYFHYDESLMKACDAPWAQCTYEARTLTSWVTARRGGPLKGGE